jgi:hypothetical protein
MSYSLPVVVLVFLGTIITVLGFLAGGSLPFVIVGLVAIFAGGVLQILGTRRSA